MTGHQRSCCAEACLQLPLGPRYCICDRTRLHGQQFMMCELLLVCAGALLLVVITPLLSSCRTSCGTHASHRTRLPRCDHAHRHRHIHTHADAHRHMLTDVHTCTCSYTHAYTLHIHYVYTTCALHVHVDTHLHAHMHTCTYTPIHMHTHTHAFAGMYAPQHEYKCVQACTCDCA